MNHTIYGVTGTKPEKRWASHYRETDTAQEKIRVIIEFDSHFSITAGIYHIHRRPSRGGRMHEEIAKYFPELEPLIKWHLCSQEGPLHYITNTVYLAGNRDENGLVEGQEQVILGPDKIPTWVLQSVPPINTRIIQHEKPDPVRLEWVKWARIGKGKERDFDAARTSAIWPEATDEQLSLPPYQLQQLLEARLPQLLVDFNVMLKSIGFPYK